MFGSTTAPSGGLFGQSQQQQQPQQQPSTMGSSLFGAKPATQSASLFGSTQQQNTTGSSLFGQPQQSQLLQPQQQQQQNAGPSLFAQSQMQQQSQQQQQPNMSNSLFGSTLRPAPLLNQVQTQSIQQQRDGLPQLRQSSAQAFAGSSVTGQSTHTYLRTTFAGIPNHAQERSRLSSKYGF